MSIGYCSYPINKLLNFKVLLSMGTRQIIILSPLLMAV
nr:MAG TPA: hypothetical protein [Bacteriophage sp.]